MLSVACLRNCGSVTNGNRYNICVILHILIRHNHIIVGGFKTVGTAKIALRYIYMTAVEATEDGVVYRLNRNASLCYHS